MPSLAPAVAMAKAQAAERALRLLSSSRQEDTTMPLLKENKENSAEDRIKTHLFMFFYGKDNAHVKSINFLSELILRTVFIQVMKSPLAEEKLQQLSC